MALTKHKGLHALLFSVVAISIFAAIQLHNANKIKAAPPASTATHDPAAGQSTTATASTSAPDAIYFNGYVYTVDDHDSVKEALVVMTAASPTSVPTPMPKPWPVQQPT